MIKVISCRSLLIFISLLLTLGISAQRIKKVNVEYTYYAPDNISLVEARKIALERAKIKAIADEFGTVIQSSKTTFVGNNSGRSSVDVLSISESDVRGEWIETIGEPKFYPPLYEQNMLVVKVEVSGSIREIVSAFINLKAKILRNGTEDKFESDEFRNGDELFLSFQAPKEGYLAVYLIDATRTAYCLLPYRMQRDGIYSIEANRHYVFFSSNHATSAEKNVVDEYVMTADKTYEYNQIYIIYSPNSFTKAIDKGTNVSLPRELPFDEFQKWLVSSRKYDKEMQVEKRDILISK